MVIPLSKNKRLIFKVLVLFLSIGLSLAICEVLLRYRADRMNRLYLKPEQFIEADQALGWRGKPNVRGWFAVNDKLPITWIEHNSKGFRSREFPKKKTNKRLIVLGDSFGWGFGVNDEDMMVNKLQNLLGKDWDVINLSVVGYSTDQELIHLEREGLRYKPDIVLLLFFMGNDFRHNTVDFIYNRYKPFFKIENKRLIAKNRFTNLSFFKAMDVYLKERLHLYLFIKQIITGDEGKNVVGNRIKTQGSIHDEFAPVELPLTLGIIKRMNEVLKERGIPLLVFIIPGQEQVYAWLEPIFPKRFPGFDPSRVDEGNKALAKALSYSHICFIDLLPMLTAASKLNVKKNLYNFTDMHWTIEGNKVAAQLIYKGITTFLSSQQAL